MSGQSTSETLLRRLRQPADGRAWERFVELYTPLLYSWARQTGCRGQDAADLVQEVLLLLLRKLPQFDYNGAGSFRGWLCTVAFNCWRDHRRRGQLPLANNGPEPDDIPVPDPMESFWQREYLNRLSCRALELMQRDFEEKTWRACWACVVEGKSAASVADELGISVGAVYVAKSRVLSRLRQELAGMLD